MKKIVGIKITTNNNSLAKDIMPLWKRYFSEGHNKKLVSKDSKTYAVYFNYDGDENGDFDLLIGVEGELFDDYSIVELSDGEYEEFIPEEGKMPEIVFDTWKKIWNTPLNRAFLTDYEVYDSSKNENQPELKIFIGVN